MSLKMVGKWVAVDYSKLSVSNGGVLLPENAPGANHHIADVVAVGTGMERDEDTGERIHSGLKPGDRILFGSRGGTIQVDGRELMVIREDDVLCRMS